MASTFTCAKCQSVVPLTAGAARRCPKCGTTQPSLAGEEAYGKSLVSKLEETEGKPLALTPNRPAEAGKKSSERVKVIVGSVAVGVGLAAALVALAAVVLRNTGWSANPQDPALRLRGLDETFTVKLKVFPEPGQPVQRRQLNSQTVLRRVSDSQGKLLQEDRINQAYEVEFTEVILEPGDKQPKRFQRTYRRAAEKVGDQARTPGYVNRTVVFELIGDQYEAVTVGEPPLPARELAELSRRLSRQDQVDALLPQRRVKVGESWPINLASFARMIAAGADVDLGKSTGTARLKTVRESSTGQLVGEIHIDLKMALKSAMGRQFDPPADFEMEGTLETAIDGSSTLGVLTTAGKIASVYSANDPKFGKVSVETVVELSGRDERTEAKGSDEAQKK